MSEEKDSRGQNQLAKKQQCRISSWENRWDKRLLAEKCHLKHRSSSPSTAGDMQRPRVKASYQASLTGKAPLKTRGLHKLGKQKLTMESQRSLNNSFGQNQQEESRSIRVIWLLIGGRESNTMLSLLFIILLQMAFFGVGSYILRNYSECQWTFSE